MTGGSMQIVRIGDTYINLNRMDFIQDYDRSDCYDMCIRGAVAAGAGGGGIDSHVVVF